MQRETPPDSWTIFRLDELRRMVVGDQTQFHEFLRTRSLSCAIYHLPKGARDMQAPHLEDEVYLVIAGRAKVKVAGGEIGVLPGTVLFVRATDEHTFFDIEEALTLIAVFGLSAPLSM